MLIGENAISIKFNIFLFARNALEPKCISNSTFTSYAEDQPNKTDLFRNRLDKWNILVNVARLIDIS